METNQENFNNPVEIPTADKPIGSDDSPKSIGSTDDLPKSIIVILVVLAVAISLLGTFTVLTEMNKLNTAPNYGGNPVQTGEISLRIEDPNAFKGQSSSVTGQILFKVERKPEE